MVAEVNTPWCSAELPFAVLYLYGPGGVGKTTLLAELDEVAEAASVTTTRVDGGAIEPSPAAFTAAFCAAAVRGIRRHLRTSRTTGGLAV
ncbi:hypothetical protein AB0I35_30680 [Nocardia sp. NPDC050378]|uniref:hypothetical protein n=1 Tax=Nocardia sp. NPDC050378 TaxID=3155400 RepID=UPI0033DB5B00